MNSLVEIGSSAFLFVSLYFEVFLLVSLFEENTQRTKAEDFSLLSVDIIVPVFNEEKTISSTLNSLLELNYPKDKFKVFVIDDGSTDGTRQILENYSDRENIKIFHKENGGKYTALNFGISISKADIVGCLDADSFVEKNALTHIVKRFADQKVMSVTPAMIIENPKGLLQKMQKAEFHYGNFMRRAFCTLNSIHITPGPFSFFRREVFEIVGPYRHAHNTEDMEMAMRLQKHHLKIVNEPKAIVHTAGPETIKKLYKQRVRWVGGFIGNLIDYREMLFNKKYGDLGILVLPVAGVGIIFTTIFILYKLIDAGISIFKNIQEAYVTETIPFHFSFEWFFINTSIVSITAFTLVLLTLFIIFFGEKTVTGKWRMSIDAFYFMFLYAIISPFWLCKAIYNNIRLRDASWR